MSLVLFGVFIALGISEFILRISQQKTYRLDACYSQDKDLHHVMIPNKVCRYKTDEWDVTYDLNSLGLRNKEISPKSDNVFRILVLGDSFVQGHGIEESKIFVRILETKLNEEKFVKKIEVVNSGVFSYSPLIEYLFLKEKGFELIKPDLVLMGINFTDFYEDRKMFQELEVSSSNVSEDQLKNQIKNGAADFDFAKINLSAGGNNVTQAGQIPLLTKIKFWLHQNLRVYKLMEGNIDLDFVAILRSDKISEEDYQKLWEIPEFSIKATSEFLKTKNISLVLFVIPSAVQVSDSEWPGRNGLGLPEHFIDKRDLGKELQLRILDDVKVFDLLPTFRKSENYPLYFGNDGHWTEAGQSLASQALFEYLRKEVLHK